MTFTDLAFLLLFLPAALIVYYVLPNRFEEFCLLVVSLVFYACASAKYLLLLVVSMLGNICLGGLMHRLRQGSAAAKCCLVVGIAANTALLGYYKYFDFTVTNLNRFLGTSISARYLLLPLGLSFYCFKAISYLADTYTHKIETFHPVTAALYLSFFAQVQSGPITRYHNCTSQKSMTRFTDGTVRFLIGFSEKILLANVLGNIVTEVFDQTPQRSMGLAWLGAVCYSLQLYYDFAGYSDMAIGIAEMFGYVSDENFRYPYATQSVSQFWRRWHISLGAWFRDYIYIPLGGSRVSAPRMYFNLLVVWMLTGLWHGANWNFILWGLGYFVLIALEKAADLPGRLKSKTVKLLYRIPVLLMVNFLWVVFRADGMREACVYLRDMLLPAQRLSNARAWFLLKDYAWFIAAAVLLAFPVIPYLRGKCEKNRVLYGLWQAVSAAAVCGAFLAALSLVVSGQNNPFIYANF